MTGPEANNVVTDVTLIDNGGISRALKIDRFDLGLELGSVDVTLIAIANGIEEINQTFTITVASNCSNPIDKDGYAIYCDDSNNYLIANSEDLLHISHNQQDSSIGYRIRSGKYKLTNDILFDIDFDVEKTYDADGFLIGMDTTVHSNNVDWSGDGFVDAGDDEGWWPLGEGYTTSTRFLGTFDGDGYKIGNLYINRPNSGYQALFGFTGSGLIKNLGVVNVSVTGNSGVAAIIGRASGYIENSYSSGAVSGVNRVGGVVGQHPRRIISCYSTADVIASESVVGGLTGHVDGATILYSYATGDVTAGIQYAGGLIGSNSASTTYENYATGNIKVGDRYGGGLMGGSSSPIPNSYATGNVKGGNYVGGLIGYNRSIIMSGYASGNVTGGTIVGGLVGLSNSSGYISNSYANGSVSGSSYTGGLIGRNDGSVSNASGLCYYTGGDLTLCTLSEILVLKSDLANGAWDDSIWENLNQINPKLEWQTAGDIVSDIDVEIPYVCVGDDPLSNIEEINGYYMIGNSADGLTIADADLARQQLLCLSNYQIATVKEASYKLTTDVAFNSDHTAEDWDGDGTADGVATEGWLPLMNYSGEFNGENYDISNVYANRPNSNYQAFIGFSSGNIKNIGLKDVNITGKTYVGGLAGAVSNPKVVSNSYVDGGSVTGTGLYTGGLVGECYIIAKSFANVSVNGVSYVGGLAGSTRSNYRNYALGNVVATGSAVGGLIGSINQGSTSDSYAMGNVQGVSGVGGLVGYTGAWGHIYRSYSTGQVTGTSSAGGLIGRSTIPLIAYASNITNSYAYWTVAPSAPTSGGLMGVYNEFVTIKNESDLCDDVGHSYYECDVLDSLSLSSIQEIQTGSTYGAWSSTYWDNLGTATPTLKDMPN